MPALAVDTEGRITATGFGSAVAKPDTVFLSFSMASRDVEPADVLRVNAALVGRVAGAMKDAGVEPRDLQTENFSLNKVKDPYNCGEFVDGQQIPCTFDGYELTTSLTLRIRKLDKFGEIVGAAVNAGAGGMNNLTMVVADAKALNNEAYVTALRDAKREAELTATTLGVELGKLISAQESASSRENGPATLFDGTKYNYRADGEADLILLPYGAFIESGELTFNKAATVTYEVVQ